MPECYDAEGMCAITAAFKSGVRPVVAMQALMAMAVATSLVGISGPDLSEVSAGGFPPPGLIESQCGTDNPFLLTTVFAPADAPTTPALLAFHNTTDNSQHFALATASQIGSTYGLAYSPEGAAYAAAYLKRGAPFGPGGPGAIYRVDIVTGDVSLWLDVPSAGADPHDPTNAYFPDAATRDLVGKSSLGDIDLGSDGRELYVMNLQDRRIYRFRVSDRTLLGAIPNGAANEPWAADARPFGLKVHEGRLFHGVVNTAETSQDRHAMEAFVYESNLDGSAMRQIAGFPLDYERGRLSLRTSARWLAWKDGYNTAAPGSDARWLGIYPQPMLSDIEFTATGDMTLGFRDRNGDMTFVYFPAGQIPSGEGIGVGGGDIVLARRSRMAGSHSQTRNTMRMTTARSTFQAASGMRRLLGVAWRS